MEVKDEVKHNFEEKFFGVENGRTNWEGIPFRCLNGIEKDILDASFLELEIKEAIWNYKGSKSPGPDGYSFMFIKKCWEFLKVDFINFFMCFYQEAILSKAITSSFLTLIPKTSNPLRLDDYRPICLVGCVYKTISKLLALILKKVLNSVVSNS